MPDSLRPHGLQHNRLRCPSLSPGVCSDSWLLSWWCYLTILSSAALSPFPFNLSQNQGLFQWVSSSYKLAKYWSFCFRISPSNEYLGLISFMIDWFDLLAVQGTLKSLLQHWNLKASVLWCSSFFVVQLSNLYTTTGKNIALTRQTFVGKVKSLLFNILSRFVIAFLPRSKNLLISWLQSLSALILEPKKRKSVSSSTFPLSICHDKIRTDAMILVFWMLSFKPTFSLPLFILIKRLFSSSSLSARIVVSSAYLRLLIFFLAILTPACDSSSLACHMMYLISLLFHAWFSCCLLTCTGVAGGRYGGLVFPSP